MVFRVSHDEGWYALFTIMINFIIEARRQISCFHLFQGNINCSCNSIMYGYGAIIFRKRGHRTDCRHQTPDTPLPPLLLLHFHLYPYPYPYPSCILKKCSELVSQRPNVPHPQEVNIVFLGNLKLISPFIYIQLHHFES